MKRKKLKFIACAAVMALTLSVTACGDSDDDFDMEDEYEDEYEEYDEDEYEDEDDEYDEDEYEDDEEYDEDEYEDDEEYDEDEYEDDTESDDDEDIDDDDVIDDEDEPEDDSEEYQTLEDYFSNPDVESIFESLIDAMSSEGLSISYEVSDNDFLMIFQITDSSMIVDGLAEGLAAELDNQAGQFKTQAAQFDSAVGEEGACTVTVRYTDPDDNVLAEQTYTAD